jgi:hypothetical protein
MYEIYGDPVKEGGKGDQRESGYVAVLGRSLGRCLVVMQKSQGAKDYSPTAPLIDVKVSDPLHVFRNILDAKSSRKQCQRIG